MLNYEMINGGFFLSDNNNKPVGFIRYETGRGFRFTPNFTCKSMRHALCVPGVTKYRWFQNLEACKYYSLAMFLEHGAE